MAVQRRTALRIVVMVSGLAAVAIGGTGPSIGETGDIHQSGSNSRAHSGIGDINDVGGKG
jgi:hypothetical protein